MIGPMPEFSRRSKLYAADLQQVARRMGELSPITAGNDIEVTNSPNVSIGLPALLSNNSPASGWFWAEVVSAPSPGLEFSDARYWIKPVALVGGTTEQKNITDTVELAIDPPSIRNLASSPGMPADIVTSEPFPMPATNLSEYVSQSHGTEIGSIVLAKREMTRGDFPSWQYVFVTGGGGLPTPQYPLQVLQGGGNNALTADFVRYAAMSAP